MTSLRNPAVRRRGLVAAAALVAISTLTTSGSSPARADSTPADTCGNLLLRKGTFTPLSAPDDAAPDPRATTYSDINNHGQLVGGYYEVGSMPDSQSFFPVDALHAVLRDRKGRSTSLDVPGADITLVYDLNDHAKVVGQYIDANADPDPQGRLPAGTVHGFMWHRGEFTTIDVPGAALTQPLGVNNEGDIVGAYIEAVDDPDPYAYYDAGRLRGFIMRKGRFTPIDFPGGEGTKVSGINDRGDMVGYYDTEDRRRGFLLRKGRFTPIDPPGSLFTLPSGIDNRGRVVGGFLDPNGINGRGFLWKQGRYTTIIAPGVRTDSIAVDINDRGEILIPADGTYYRLPEIACGRPTVPASVDQQREAAQATLAAAKCCLASSMS